MKPVLILETNADNIILYNKKSAVDYFNIINESSNNVAFQDLQEALNIISKDCDIRGTISNLRNKGYSQIVIISLFKALFNLSLLEIQSLIADNS